MCKNCGCGHVHGSHEHEHGHDHNHEHGDGEVHFHTDENGNVYSHSHRRIVPVESAVLAENDAVAEANRKWLHDRGIVSVNLISSPGSGKTALLEKTLAMLHSAGIAAAVVVGDQYGEADAERMRGYGAAVTQIETHDACHLSAEQLHSVLEDAVPEGTKLLIIENVGNLVCPVAFDLGEDRKIALLSTPEGEEKPLKYPGLFAAADTVLLTKIDLAEVLEWNRELCRENILRINPDAEIIEVSARKNIGLDAWLASLKKILSSNNQ